MKVMALVLFAAVTASAASLRWNSIKQTVTLTGVVTKVEGRTLTSGSGSRQRRSHREVCELGCEMGSPNALQCSGWTVATMKEGMVVSLNGSRAKDGSTK